MIINDRITDAERKEIEDMLLLDFLIPSAFGPFRSRKFRKRIVYILTPVLILLSLFLYYQKSYFVATVGILACVIELIAYIEYKVLSEKRVHQFVWDKPTYNILEITDNAIIGDGVSISNFEILKRVIKYHNIYFLLTDEKILGLIKIGEEQAPEFIDILNEKNISFEEKNEPFNIYSYVKKNK